MFPATITNPSAAGLGVKDGDQGLPRHLARVIGSETLMRMGVKPLYCAGHSIGAFAAAVACGTLDFVTGLEVVRRRAALMQSAFPNGYGMGAIVGTDETSANRLVIELASAGYELFLAIINRRHQIVVTGKTDAVDAALAFARFHSARSAGRLRVATPSHCILLHDVAGMQSQLPERMWMFGERRNGIG
jgi:malonate decarboxylase epsilon subunit